MKEYINERGFCYFHPRELVVGVCALCLSERLLILASDQSHNKASRRKYNTLPKIFALTNLLNRLDIKQHKAELYYSSSTSPEDSFISIKFEENGAASWDKGTKITKMPPNQQTCEISMKGSLGKGVEIKSVVEHSKPRPALRWRKRFGHLFQVIRWKRSNKSNVSHVGTKLGAKVRYGWIKTLTKRRTNQE